MPKYESPAPDSAAFTCPYCGTFAQMWYQQILVQDQSPSAQGYAPFAALNLRKCSVCYEHMLWWGELMLLPDSGKLPSPHEEMPERVKDDYVEAASISGKSPRAASAMLRQALERLLKEDLGRKERTLNDMIGGLAGEGLDPTIVRAMDVVRVHGNDNVHPGQIVAGDDSGTVAELAKLINFVIEDRIARPRRISEMYNAIPDDKRKAAEERNAKNRATAV